jgi:hypothetical protein
MKKKSTKEEYMTVNRFITILKMVKDADIAPIEFWVGEKEYTLDSVGQFGIMANVTLHFKEIENSDTLRPVVFQKKNRKEANKIAKKIKKEHSKK